MVILAIDTSTRAGSLALVRVGEDSTVQERADGQSTIQERADGQSTIQERADGQSTIQERVGGQSTIQEIDARVGDPSRTHGERLPTEVLRLLADHSLGPADVGRYGVIAGPGSFTGLRVGIATIQGLALASAVEVVAVPTLEALVLGWRRAHPSAAAGVDVAWMDGQRGDVFYGAWRRSPTMEAASVAGPGEVVIASRVGRPEDLIADVGAIGDESAVTMIDAEPGADPGVDPRGARGRDAVHAALTSVHFVNYDGPLALVAALVAAARPDLAASPHALKPIYLRRPDAALAPSARPKPSSVDIIVSRVTPGDDLSAVSELQRRSFTNPWGADAIQWELTHTDVARLFVARSADAADGAAGAMLAYCACWLLFDELHINSLAVEERLRRHGVARTLLRGVFAEAVKAGARAATLEVRRSNEAARRLYEGLGFVVEAVRRDYYQLPREDALILWNRHLAASGGLW
jgi:ribosomal-protein-alanine N-acetyltransferase